jgi:hypothetical protein
MVGPIIRNYDKRIYKKCIKCRAWYPREDILDDDGNLVTKHGFGKHADSSDGLQSICFTCKNAMNIKARSRNVTSRIRHHIGTRCLTQLGKTYTPIQFVACLEDYLGYKITTLVKSLQKDLKEREGAKRKLRDALNEGYHIDHIKPLSSFPVITHGVVDWDEFRKCWAVDNLSAIPADENLAKGATYEPEPNAQASNGNSNDDSANGATSDDTNDDNVGAQAEESAEANEERSTEINISASTEDPN